MIGDEMSEVCIRDTEITVSATLVAEGFGLTEDALRALLRRGIVTSRWEKGEAEDAGRYRLNFFYGNRVLRLTVDAGGNLFGPARIDFRGYARPGHLTDGKQT